MSVGRSRNAGRDGKGPVDGPLPVFGALLMPLRAVLYHPDELDHDATRTVRRRLAAAGGLLEAPTARAVYDLLRPHL